MGMTVESKEFSGKIRLTTQKGVVELEIESARVIKGRKILEKSRIRQRVQLREAWSQLHLVLDKLPPPTSRGLTNWQRRRHNYLEVYGEEHVFNLLPKNPNKETEILSRAINGLIRNGIYTRKDLARQPLEEIAEFRNVGEKTLEVIEAMRNLAIAQLRFKKSRSTKK